MEGWRRSPVGVFLGVGGLVFAGAFFVSEAPTLGAPLDAGELEPIQAVAAEETDVRTLNPGETLGRLLGEADLSGTERNNLLMVFREHGDPSRIRAGTEVTLRWERGNGELRGVDVGVSPDETLQMTRSEFGWNGRIVETPVQADTVSVAGEIERDLWSAVVMNPDLREVPRQDRARLIDLMDRIFQWQVDFSRQIRTDDSFRLVFEREVRPDGTMREARILAAELVNRGEPFHAIWFDLEGDGDGGYYDLDGESVRRAFLTKPLEYRRISSGFDENRFHPILEERRPHYGVDYAAATGTPVMATGDGEVVRRGRHGGYGNLVELRHANGFRTLYAHLNGFASGLNVGDRVSQGEVIGYVGQTGMATGPHLHYELHRDDQPMDPLSVDIPAGEPIPSERMEEWRAGRDAHFALLEELPAPPQVRMAVEERLRDRSVAEVEEEE